MNVREIIAEVKERNHLRAEAGLSPVSVATEVRRIMAARREAELQLFLTSSPLRPRIIEAKLLEERIARDDPTWEPKGVLSGGGGPFALKVDRELSRFFER